MIKRNPLQFPASEKHSSTRAQGMVEFAMTLPLLLMLVLGIFEFGRLLFVYSSVISAAREAARYGAASGEITPLSGVPYYADCNGIRAAARRIGGIAGINQINIWYEAENATDPTVFSPKGTCGAASGPIELGDRIAVEVIATFRPMQGIVPMPNINIRSIVRRTLIVNLSLD